MGPAATQHFLDVLMDELTECLDPRRDQDYPDMTILMESSMPDRTEQLLSGRTEAGARINAALSGLADQGCRPIIVTCITAHALIEPARFENGVLDFRTCLVRQNGRVHSEPLGIVATTGSVSSGVFDAISTECEIRYPDDEHQRMVMEIIYGERGLKTARPDADHCRALLDRVSEHLRGKGAGYCVAGCTEVEMFTAQQSLGDEFLFPMQLLAKEICQSLARERRRPA
jgi:aspartate/glutamate racemase